MRLVFPLLTLTATTAHADLRVVTDIAPLHSLVAQVAGPDVQVDVLVSGSASPHDFQFSFDQAAAVQNADLIIWVGAGLTPWLSEALTTLAAETPSVALLDGDDWPSLPLRDDDAFDAHDDHGHGHEEEDDHGHDDDQGDAHDDHNEHQDNHDDEHDKDHSDGHGAVDPHAWLDPQVAAIWVDEIARALAAADPDNTALYGARAADTLVALAALEGQINDILVNVPTSPYLVPHDAYQYFERRFDRPAAGAISLSDAAAPSPDRIAELQAYVRDEGVACVLTDPQSRDAWVELVRDGTDTRTALADPMGSDFAIGVDHYAQTMLAIAQGYADCLTPQ